MSREQRDYYEILGISKQASLDEIKKAYRALAIKYHPDKNQGNKKAEMKFKESTEAYEVLRDDKKRDIYDRFGHDGLSGSASQGGGFGQGAYTDFTDIFSGTSFEDIFENIFAGSGFSFGRSSYGTQSRQGSDLRYNLEINLEDVYYGKDITIQIPREEHCDTCNATGSADGKETICTTCGGAGQVRRTSGFFSVASTCPACNGQGKSIASPCLKCRGKGVVSKVKQLQIRVPKGVESGTRLKVTGEGEAGLHGGSRGDLYVVLKVKQHSTFERDEANIFIGVELPMITAVLGGDISVQTLSTNQVRLKIPPGTQPNTQFRIKNKGLPLLSSNTRYGDIIVEINITIPKNMSSKAKGLFKELKTELENAKGAFSRFT